MQQRGVYASFQPENDDRPASLLPIYEQTEDLYEDIGTYSNPSRIQINNILFFCISSIVRSMRCDFMVHVNAYTPVTGTINTQLAGW